MFESILHISDDYGISSACYVDGDVIGQVTFGSDPRRIVIFSKIGPIESTRECLAIYRGHGRPIVKDEINSYA
ncbi:hypothetical protein [Pseudomonas tohonis]|uniref:Uncharacterized protein n=1 Tax=Pseudomonas tohonis TaxID=2725477 RepID=A0ABQ4VSX5_9PSED|nr:hypothetical protein [Pseudomonas tohonis]GJN50813.1 hypothetical protein TUM20286_05650 [Pseudomonas tohonis]